MQPERLSHPRMADFVFFFETVVSKILLRLHMKKVQSASVTVANGNHLSYIAHFSYLEAFRAISLHLIHSPVLTSCFSTFSSVFAAPRNASGVLSLVRARHFSHFIYSLSCPFISLQPS